MIKSIWEMLVQGGPVMLPIIIISLVLWALIIEKMLELKKEDIDVDSFTDQLIGLLNKGKRTEAIKLCQSNTGMASKILQKGLIHEEKTREFIMENVKEVVLEEYSRLEHSLPTIGTLASVAPLLGLLGTVVGMISTFTSITFHGTGDPQALAGGISQSLITTQSGLIVAIPALFFHNYLIRKLNIIMDDIERNVIRFVNVLKKED